MLVEFSVANYRSFRERVTLSMEAEPRLSERDKSVDERNIAHVPGGDILRVAGVYGANASGKSNLVRALGVLRSLVLDSARGQDGDPVPSDPFRLDPVTAAEPTEMEVVYLDAERQVRYGVAFSREKITREWLLQRPHGAAEESLLFERVLSGDAYSYTTGEGWLRLPALEDATRKEALHLSAASQLNHRQAQVVLEWFRSLRLINGLTEGGLIFETTRDLDDPAMNGPIRSLIQRLNFGVDDVQLVPLNARIIGLLEDFTRALQPVTPHSRALPAVPQNEIRTLRQGVPFELKDESAGTARVISFAGPLVRALAHGHTVVIDELDARLHTLLTLQLVSLFQDPEVNRHNAQLIFASHDTNLLNRALIRRDQLWFVEKSPLSQASQLYSLAEIRLDDGKKVRNDARYEDDYLHGRYGAIPFFGGLRRGLAEALDPGDKE